MSTLLIDDRHVSQVETADTWSKRARGMLWRRELPDALLIRPCNSVHGAGMRVPLDVAFVDAQGTVVDITVLRPWAMTMPRRGAVAVLEAPMGNFRLWGLATGSAVRVSDGAAESAS